MNPTSEKELTLHRTIDNFGATASLLCAIHCLAMPLLLTLLPALGLSFLLNENLEKAFVLGTIALASFNSCWGYRLHKRSRVFIFIFIGSALLLLATFAFDHQHLHHGHDLTHTHDNLRPQDSFLGLTMLVCGAITLAIGHILNRFFCNSCKKHAHGRQCQH